jgi:type I restriction enzyme, R subunit
MIREECAYTAGRTHISGQKAVRGKSKYVEYLLVHKNVPLAVVEAKDNKHTIGAGMQQGLGYAADLDVPFVYSSNGDGFLEHGKLGTSM